MGWLTAAAPHAAAAALGAAHPLRLPAGQVLGAPLKPAEKVGGGADRDSGAGACAARRRR